MTNSRLPGPLGTSGTTQDLNDGTMMLGLSPQPGPIGVSSTAGRTKVMSDGRKVTTMPDGSVKIINPDGTIDMRASRRGGSEAIRVPPAPRGNPLAPFFGESGAEALSNLATLGKVADLQCIADAKLKTRAFGDLGLQADLVQGGGVKIKGDSPLFKTDDTWIISRRAIDSSNYRLVATSVGTQKSYELTTMGGNASAVISAVFSGDGLLTYANPIEVREAFPGTRTLTLRDALDGMENKEAAKVLEKVVRKSSPSFVDLIDGRIQFGKSLSLNGQRIAVGCSVDAAQGIPRLTSVLAGIPGMAIEDWAKSVVRGR